MKPNYTVKNAIIFYIYCIFSNWILYILSQIIFVIIIKQNIFIPFTDILKGVFVNNLSQYIQILLLIGMFHLPFFVIYYLAMNFVQLYYLPIKGLLSHILLIMLGVFPTSLFLFFLVIQDGWSINTIPEKATTIIYLLMNLINIFSFIKICRTSLSSP